MKKKVCQLMNPRTFDYASFLLRVLNSLIKISSIFFKMQLIDSIMRVERDRVIEAAVFVAVLKLGSYIVESCTNMTEFRFEKSRRYDMIGKVMDKTYELSLSKAEEQATQELLNKSEQFYARSKEFYLTSASLSHTFLVLASLMILLPSRYLWVSALMILMIGLIGKANIAVTKRTYGFWDKYMENARRFNYFSDILSKREFAYEKRIYDYGEKFNERFSQEFECARKVNVKNSMIRFRMQLLIEGALIAGTIFGMTAFIPALSAGQLTLGRYTVLVEQISLLLSAVSKDSGEFFKLGEYLKLQEQILGFLDKKEANRVSGQALQGQHILLQMKEVSFAYPDQKKEVLNNVSFTLEKGKKYGLVGVNGAGKTSLVKLMTGLYQPQKGSIIKSGELLCSPRPAMVLFQDFNTYPVTIREFLLLGNEKTVAEEQLWEALRKVSLAEDIAGLKKGINTPLSLMIEGGTLLSKGQMQKLGIARAFLSSAPLMILDEPTASLDPVAEKELYEQCFELFDQQTTLYITHRLGAVKNTDEILVIDGGSIAESGTHEELIQKKGRYYELYQTQKSLYMDEKEVEPKKTECRV